MVRLQQTYATHRQHHPSQTSPTTPHCHRFVQLLLPILLALLPMSPLVASRCLRRLYLFRPGARVARHTSVYRSNVTHYTDLVAPAITANISLILQRSVDCPDAFDCVPTVITPACHRPPQFASQRRLAFQLTEPQTSNLKPQTSNLKPQTSNLKPQTSHSAGVPRVQRRLVRASPSRRRLFAPAAQSCSQ